ncbi:DUF3102 domain-containing protein [Oculatella sp. LEGE 06141]|uniref:DUF3102 domain-containing protein n=1 Tax=Oculatella sp. LEGE 06141 TaxID=1828648 RepID=UPI001881AA15|nr:DUF3102 domain-containing protein [Oculatella sp. LEGE 06141]MBE9178620.1 DUF3102 domain-containing protein [Oculatella sp. LEGE 06141]
MATAVEVLYDFDYNQLDVEQRVVVQQRTSEIKSLLRHRAQNAVEIGQKLLETKEILGYGHYRAWIESEFALGKTIANHFENVAKQFANVPNVDSFDSSALRVLAAPSVPEEIRQEAIALAAAGEYVSHAKAKELTGKAKPEAKELFQPGQAVQVTDFAASHQGETVEVLEVSRDLIECKTPDGETVSFFRSDLDTGEAAPSAKPAPKPKASKPHPIATLDAKLDLASTRLELMADLLRRSLIYLPPELKAEAEELLN